MCLVCSTQACKKDLGLSATDGMETFYVAQGVAAAVAPGVAPASAGELVRVTPVGMVAVMLAAGVALLDAAAETRASLSWEAERLKVPKLVERPGRAVTTSALRAARKLAAAVVP